VIDYNLVFNTTLHQWEIFADGVKIAVRQVNDPCSPGGEYLVTVGPCAGNSIIVSA
jgi:hypothetical protein